MTGLILDAVLMLLLVAALGYGVRLERKLATLRQGQTDFARAVGELNAAAGRAEAALGSLRVASQETDLLHDRILKAQALKLELEALTARTERGVAPAVPAAREPVREPPLREEARPGRSAPGSLAERIQALAAGEASGRNNLRVIVQAMTANQAAKQSLNQARRRLDDDLFAA
ncbi:MAG: DUF6468 domain-containing protein [Brevundimonas sp.]|jgi:hypothetical protein|uniref:DUF6468 domain-containing protein n=1 Tax=Brevundimonas sp. TaxID=1871086 RepID=UPI003919A315